MVRISKRISKSCKKMTDFYVRIVNAPRLKNKIPIVFLIEDVIQTEQIQSKLAFLKIDDIPPECDEIPDLLDEVIDPIEIEESEVVTKMRAAYEYRCEHDTFFQRRNVIFIDTEPSPYPRPRDPRIPRMVLSKGRPPK